LQRCNSAREKDKEKQKEQIGPLQNNFLTENENVSIIFKKLSKIFKHK